ncbi:prepilin peptidase [Methylocystis parvus]|uniref:Prepilin peptidase n=1 Tax=Methylocystis parvus TaxID=134 RepID=A0A6B8M2T1_9HYPH|nr:A24 family peptidase [Methylocystis parvus]QGM96079.1 prepilin peptidase [Methylocystis parvus]WBK00098.1 A24 family peptidase [Methylocystis parvus OBBP]
MRERPEKTHRQPIFASPACGRRRRALAPLARRILLARDEGRPFAPAAWAALLSLAALLAEEPGFIVWPSLLLFGGLCLISLFDARYFVIPDGPLLALALCGGAVALANAPHEAALKLAAGAAGYAAFRSVAFIYARLRGEAGVGEGDAKLYGLAGLWLGFSGLPGALVYGVLSALLSSVIAMRQGTLESVRQPIPFGPHLALGLWLIWVFGPLEAG